MSKHFKYLSYVIRHKWFVFQQGRHLGVSLWQLITHDWQKFTPREWFPYVDFFYGGPHPEANHGDMRNWFGDVGTKSWVERRFNEAWLHHQHYGPHHWQHWILCKDSGDTIALEMPEKFVREMIADWAGAGRAITGKIDICNWYSKNQEKIVLHENTRKLVDVYLSGFYGYKGTDEVSS